MCVNDEAAIGPSIIQRQIKNDQGHVTDPVLAAVGELVPMEIPQSRVQRLRISRADEGYSFSLNCLHIIRLVGDDR